MIFWRRSCVGGGLLVDRNLGALRQSFAGGFDVMVLADNELARRGLSEMLRSIDAVQRVRSAAVGGPFGKPSVDEEFDVLIVSCDNVNTAPAHRVAGEAWSRGVK